MRTKMFGFESLSRYRNVFFGFAALWIVLFHCNELSFGFIPFQPIAAALTSFKEFGNTGVDIFLLLSGFGLYYSMEKNGDILSFYKKRALRVLPAALAVSIIFNALIPHPGGIAEYLSKAFLISFFIDGDTTFWYISMILLLYLLFPVIFRVIKKLRSRGFFLLLLISLLLNAALLVFFPKYYDGVEIGFARIPVFLFGVWVAQLAKSGFKLSVIKTILICLALLITCIALMSVFYDYFSVHIWFVRIFYGWIAVAVVFLSSVLFNRFSLKRLKSFFVLFGVYSMEIYLIFQRVTYFSIGNFYADPWHICDYFASFAITFLLSVALKAIVDKIFKQKG